MSETILSSIISGIMSIIGAFIGLFGSIVIQRKQDSPISCAIVGLCASIGAVFGLVGGLFVGAYFSSGIVQPSRSSSFTDTNLSGTSMNLLQNASFEQGVTGWQRHGQTEITSISNSYKGKGACSQQNTTNELWAGVYQDVAVSNNSSYYVEIYTEHRLGVEVHVKVQWLDSNYNVLYDGERIGETVDGESPGWERRSGIVTPPSTSVKFARLSLWHGVRSSTGIRESLVCIDEAIFRPN